jgi:hypothetical protein
MKHAGPMNSDNIAANGDKIIPDHVLEVDLDEGRPLVRGFNKMITESDVT